MQAGTAAQEVKTLADIQEVSGEVGIIQSQMGDLTRKLASVSLPGPLIDPPKDVMETAPSAPLSPVRSKLAQLLLQVKEAKRTLSSIMGALDI